MAWSLTSNRTRKKSPLKEPPLPAAGDSLAAEIEDVKENYQAYWLGLAACMVAVIVMEWYSWYFSLPPKPVVMTVMGLLIIGFCVWRAVRLELHITRLRGAQQGEQHVGQVLDQLRRDGYEVFHDLAFDGHNVDHVLVGPGGVFSVETKTISKPMSGDSRVTYDGERILVAGMAQDRDPIGQARAAADDVRRIIQDHSGRLTKVRPVVLYPGWYVDKQPYGCTVWVLEPKALLAFIRKERRSLSHDEVTVYGAAITRYLQAQQKKRAEKA